MQKPLYFRNNGLRLAGTLHLPAGKGPFPAVAMLHGFMSEKAESHYLFVRLSRRLEEAGIASLRFDFRGCGESEGRFEDTTVAEQASDARAALATLRLTARIDSERLGLVGMSLGGLVAALAAAEEPDLASLVLWGAIARPVKVFESIVTKPGARELARRGRLDAGGLYISTAFAEAMAAADPCAAISRSKAPVFIIHATGDRTVPYVNSTDLLRAAKARRLRSERLSVAGADHTFSSVDWSEAVIDATAEWFTETLAPPSLS